MATVSIIMAFLVALFLSSTSAVTNPKLESWEKNRLMINLPLYLKRRIRLIREEILNNGCDTNICFVLDRSQYITEQEFQDQKDFVDLIVAITTTDEPGNYCANVYDKQFQAISPLTKQKEAFLNRVLKQRLTYNAFSPNVLPGLGNSIKQLRRQRGDANTVLFFAKNKPINTNAPYFFREFVERGNAITAVTFNSSIVTDLAKLTGDINRIFPIDGFFQISEIIIGVVADVCSTDCTTLPPSRSRPGKRLYRRRFNCPTRLGERRAFKGYKGVGGVGVGFGSGTSSTPVNPKRKPRN